MYRYTILIFIFSIIHGFVISPYSKISFNSDSDLYASQNAELSKLNIGLKFIYDRKPLRIRSDFSYNIYSGSSMLFDDFNSIQGLGKVEQSAGLALNQYNYFSATFNSKYSLDKIEFYANISSPQWGPGKSIIVLSGKAPPYFNTGYIWKLGENISYEHMYGSLVSMIEDTTYNHLYNTSNRNPYYKRNIFSHSLSIDIHSRLSISLFEMIIYGGNRIIESYYMIPLIPFLPTQTYLGDIDNDMIAVALEYNPINKLNLYSTLVIDEWSPTYTFKKDHKNWFIYQFGAECNELFMSNDKLIKIIDINSNKTLPRKRTSF